MQVQVIAINIQGRGLHKEGAALTGINAPLPDGRTVDTDAIVVSVVNTVAMPLSVVGTVIVEIKVTVVGEGDSVMVMMPEPEGFGVVVKTPEPVGLELGVEEGVVGVVVMLGESHGCPGGGEEFCGCGEGVGAPEQGEVDWDFTIIGIAVIE